MNHSIASPGALGAPGDARSGCGTAAHRFGGSMQQQQQQVRVTAARRRQQQQGSTDFQPVAHHGHTPLPGRPAQAKKPETPADAHDGGHGGTPVGRLQNGTDNARETKSYIDEASRNIDA